MRSARRARNRPDQVKTPRLLRDIGSAIFVRFAPTVGSAYIRFVSVTTRWQWEGRAHLQAVIDERTPVIFAFWHSRLLMMCPRMEESPLPIRVLVSQNRDGEVISKIVRRFGHDTIRGSTRNPKKIKDKGSGPAVLEMMRHLRSGGSAAITPDGPRGPVCVAQDGASMLSAQTGLPVIPLSYSTNSAYRLSSWDRFLFALPFGRGAYVVGPPIPAPPPDDENALNHHREQLEKALTELMHRADIMAGRRDRSL